MSVQEDQGSGRTPVSGDKVHGAIFLQDKLELFESQLSRLEGRGNVYNYV